MGTMSKIRFAKVEWLEQRALYSGNPVLISGAPAAPTESSNPLLPALVVTSEIQTTGSNKGAFSKVTYNGFNYIDTSVSGQTNGTYLDFRTSKLDGTDSKFSYPQFLSRTYDAATNTFVEEYREVRVTVKLSTFDDRVSWAVSIENKMTDRQITGYNWMPTTVRFSSSNPIWSASQVNGVDGVQALTIKDGDNQIVVTHDTPGVMRTTQIRGWSTGHRLRVGTMYIAGDKGSYPTATPMVTIAPGAKDEFTVSLRFAPVEAPITQVAPDVIQQTSQNAPFRLGNWNDRRTIGAIWLHSGNNVLATINTSTPAGKAEYQRQALRMAQDIVTEVQTYDLQGVIFWDLEGHDQYVKNYAYAGDPTKIPSLNPAFDEIADQFFQVLRNGGVKFGMTIRDAELVQLADGSWYQSVPTDSTATYRRKFEYATSRWGATLFYVDYPNPANPGALDVVQAEYPQTLMIPEGAPGMGTGYNAFSSPFFDARLGIWKTPDATRAVYPEAFSSIWVGDIDASANSAKLVEAVRGGDILIGHLFTSARVISQIAHSAGVPLVRPPANSGTPSGSSGNGGSNGSGSSGGSGTSGGGTTGGTGTEGTTSNGGGSSGSDSTTNNPTTTNPSTSTPPTSNGGGSGSSGTTTPTTPTPPTSGSGTGSGDSGTGSSESGGSTGGNSGGSNSTPTTPDTEGTGSAPSTEGSTPSTPTSPTIPSTPTSPTDTGTSPTPPSDSSGNENPSTTPAVPPTNNNSDDSDMPPFEVTPVDSTPSEPANPPRKPRVVVISPAAMSAIKVTEAVRRAPMMMPQTGSSTTQVAAASLSSNTSLSAATTTQSVKSTGATMMMFNPGKVAAPSPLFSQLTIGDREDDALSAA